MKKIKLPVAISGIELPLERTFLTVADLKNDEEAWIPVQGLTFTKDRKGVLQGHVQVLAIYGKVNKSLLNFPANQGYPLLRIKRNGLLFDVTLYYQKNVNIQYQRSTRGGLEDGGKQFYFLSSYKEEPINLTNGANLTWNYLQKFIATKEAGEKAEKAA